MAISSNCIEHVDLFLNISFTFVIYPVDFVILMVFQNSHLDTQPFHVTTNDRRVLKNDILPQINKSKSSDSVL